jgi:malate dehydrogenase (quinone)
LFGPFAGFSTKFLKEGSYLDLPESVNFKNIRSLLSLVAQYAFNEIFDSASNDEQISRMSHLRDFVKDAKEKIGN